MDAPQYDVVIVGAGPAGLAAAMFTARRGLKTVLVSKDLGGQLALTDFLENYPGIDRIGGRELVDRMLAQVKRDGAEFRFGEAMGIEQHNVAEDFSPPRGGLKAATTAQASIYAVRTAEGDELATHTIILAFGLTPNDLGCEGEQRLNGKGVYYSAVADAPKQDGKTIAIVGGGNSAVTAALELAPRAAKVLLVHRRAEFRAERALLDRLGEHANIETMTPYTVAELKGDEHVRAMVLAHAETGDTKEVAVDSVFVQIGFSAKTKWLEGIVPLNAKREVVIDRDCATSVPGIFAAGDLTDITYKQAVVTAGEGVKAALQAFKHLQTASGKPAIMIDWDVRGK